MRPRGKTGIGAIAAAAGVAAALSGCSPGRPAVYVDLEALAPPMPPAARALDLPPSPAAAPGSAEFVLPALSGQEHSLAEARSRLARARQLVASNRAEALRGLRSALYRTYAREAEGERRLRELELEKTAQDLWDRAFDRLHELLQEHAKDRTPYLNVLALLAGFPLSNPALRPRPENRQDARRYDRAVEAWKRLQEEDAEFAALARRFLESVEDEIAARRTDILADFTRALNQAADRSAREAEQAIAGRGPDFEGRLGLPEDVRLPTAPAREATLGPAPPPPSQPFEPFPAAPDLSREFLEHDLHIWLAQNGYVRAAKPEGGADATQEFADWMRKRRAGP
jgi:hypothetical protein